MRQMNFIENPSHRTPADKPVGAMIAGHRWDSVFIEVSMSTYISEHFRNWLAEGVMPRIMPEGSIRIAIIYPGADKSPELN
jgi:hypothetical protein